MKKLKEVFDFIKNKLADKRTRAITILSLYFIFFVVIFIFISLAPKTSIVNDNDDTEKIVNYENINKNYKYEYTIEIEKNNQITKYLIEGVQNESEYTEVIKQYNIDTNDYELIYESEDINSLFINRDNLISYVNNLKEEFETDYKDGTIQKNYLVDINTIDKNYNSETIEINVFEKENFINKIIVDGTNLDNKSKNNIIASKYTLIYTQIEE